MLKIDPHFSSSPVICAQETLSSVSGVPRTTSPGVITDRPAVISHTGIAAGHLTPLQHLAAEQQLVISFRPVEVAATGLISDGYPTKGFNIKGKSANWGPMAGFIPVDQFYSKLCGQKHKTELMNKKVAECLQNGHAVSGNLQITGSRINDLVHMRLLTRYQPDKNGIITLESQSPHGHRHLFTAKPAADGLYTIYTEKSDIPVKVLCSPQLNKPLTADYDLMIVAPRTEDFGSQDIPHNPDVDAEFFLEKRPYLLTGNTTIESIRQELRRREDINIGNETARVTELIPKINTALGLNEGYEVVHHATEVTNTGTDMSTNFPVTFFLPEPLGGLPQMLLAEDTEGLRTVIHTLESNGFMVPHNPLWSEEIPSLRRESFEATRRFYNTL